VIAPPDAGEFLGSTALLGRLPVVALEELAKTVRWLTLPGGETLFRRGDPGESIYLVASGRLRVSDGALEREAARGDCVGELALLTGERRSATVVAVRDTELAELTRADFDRVAERYPAAILDLARLVAARLLGAGDNRDVPPVSTIALVPMPGVNLNEIAIVIRDALSTIGSTLHVSAARELVADEQARTRWLNAQEFEHTFVLYEADEGLTSWTRCCIRQADRVLMFARPDSPRAIPGIPASSELVLIHRAAPVGTDRWPADAFACRHHVLENSREDLERVVRHVTGHAVGLVLSGGGARAFAQIGVVRALGEAGVPIDRVGGTSIGAVLGAQIAARNDWRRLVELHRGRWRNDYTLPHLALLAGKRTRKGVEAWFGDTRIEDLWLPFFCVSTNLSSAEMVVHRQGVVRDAVRASMSVPGVLPPFVREDGELLVDGGLLNNLPTNFMRALGPGTIIAVDVSPRLDSKLTVERALPRVRDAALSLLRPSGRKSVNILRILQRATLVPSIELGTQARGESDFYLAPPVQDVDLLDWSSLERVAEIGYHYASEQIAEWRHALPAVEAPIAPGVNRGAAPRAAIYARA